jgi:tRNA threonylcarbamoyladenosine biosynthesis protein TsaB
MRVLALDTCLASCSAALVGDGEVLAWRAEAMRKGHAERIVPMVQQVMDEAGCAWGDLDLLAVTTGPGSFTGVRVGLAAARAIALVAGRPLAGIGVMEAMARAIAPQRLSGRGLVVALDARRGELYLQDFDSAGRALGGPRLADRLDLEAPAGPCLVAGDGAGAFAAFGDCEIDTAALLPDARAVAQLAAERHGTGGDPMPQAMPVPVYLREADARRPEDVAPVVLRREGPESAAVLAGLHLRCMDDPWSESFLGQLLAQDGAVAILARLRADDSPVGFALLRLVADEAELLSIGVVPEHRREGIAQRLVAACYDRCRAGAIVRLHLEVAEDNTAARRLYARAGYLPIGRRKGYYAREGGAVDALTLARPVP